MQESVFEGTHLLIRFFVFLIPVPKPYFNKASAAYSEQLG